MYRKDQNFKSVILKVFLTYFLVYFLALIIRYNYDLENLLINLQYKYLILLNIVSIFLGLPLSIIFDFLLLKFFGLSYIAFFSPVLTILSVIQVLLLRKMNFRFFKVSLFLKKPQKNYFFRMFENINFRPFYILIIRSFPILPHILGSYIIASSNIKKSKILLNTLLGCFFYYIFLYFIIGIV